MKELLINVSFCKNTEDWNSRDYNPYTIDFYLKAEDLLKSKGKFGAYWYRKINPPKYKHEKIDPKPTHYRKEEYYIQGSMNMIILDIDDGFTIDEFIKKYRYEFVFALGTTRSHTNEKHKFRVLIPLGKQIELPLKDIKDINKHILGKTNMTTGEVEINGLFPFADQACTDGGRVYRGNPNVTTYINMNTTKLFDYSDVHEVMMQWRRIQEYKAQQMEENRKHRESGNENTFADWCRDNWLSDRMYEALRISEGWGQGGRTVFLNKKVYGWTKSGFTDDEVVEMTLWANAKSGDPLDERRIQNQIFKTLGLRMAG